MLIADEIIVNCAEAPVTPPRTEQSLSELGLSVVGADWGESASGQSGSEPKTRTIVLDLICREDADVDLPTAAYRLQQIVGQMQEESETWIKRVPKVGGDWAGPGMYRIRRSPTATEPQVTLSGLGGWQVGDNQPVTLTMVADFPFYSTEEVEGEKHSTTTARQLVYTEPASEGSTKGLSRTLVTNDNSSGDWRGLIWARECRDYSADATAELAYLAKNLTPKGGAEVKTVSGAEVIQHTALTSGWQTIMSTLISASGLHMTHRGGRRPWMRVLDPGSTVDNLQLRLVWRTLGSSSWTEDNPIATVYAVGDWCLVDLGAVLPQIPAVGDERWEGKLMARARSGSGSIRLRDFYPFPTEQYVVMSESEEAPIDGEPTKLPGTAEDSNVVGDIAWSNPNNIRVEDGICATAVVKPVSEEDTHYLKATNFGLAVPESATVQGIAITIVRRDPAHVVGDTVLKLVKGGTIQTQSKAKTGLINVWPTALAAATYGGLGDLWGTTWTPAQVNASNFGMVLQAGTYGGEATAEVDSVRVTVYYTEGQNKPVICSATRLVDIRSDGVVRQAPTEDVWGPVIPDGFLPFASPGALEGRTQRTIIVPTLGDFEERADSGTPNKLTAQEFARAGYHVAREAA